MVKRKTVRNIFRDKIVGVCRRILNSDELKSDCLKITSEFTYPRFDALKGIENLRSPYEEAKCLNLHSTSIDKEVIFITGRFRSGSTLLWNIFRNLDGFTSYYEPLHERRWFDLKTRGNYVDTTHIGVENYWKEYEGLEFLGEYYQDEWVEKNLFMDAYSFDHNLQKYINGMIHSAKDIPVLQFNRVDFRLAWLKKHYPSAKVLHIFRNPRDQYISFLKDPKSYPHNSNAEYFPDNYFLANWAKSLKAHFPFLDKPTKQHPYITFYFIWKLSYLYSKKFSGYSIKMEDLINNPQLELSNLFSHLNISSKYVEDSSRIIKQQPLGKWKNYADNDWFLEKEKYCEEVLSVFLDGVK